MSQQHLASYRVQFRDTDAAGIMHFSAFVTYMEQSEHDLLRSVGMTVMKYEVDGMSISWPRVSVHCDFTRPLHFEQEFEVVVTIEKLGGKSIRYGFEFLSSGESMATGHITAVCCVVNDGVLSAIQIPDSVREKLLPFLKA